jgi:CubicO group peptidase (beta-lactamase class C family)
MRMKLAQAMLAGIGLLTAGGVHAAPTDAELQRCLMGAAESSGLNGVAIIAHLGSAVAVAARGTMGPADARPIGLDTRFNIASAGKMFTATAIGQLVAAGKVRFEDTVGRWLPDAPAFMAALRVDQLLTHTSGLGDAIFAHREASDAATSVSDLLRIVYSDPPAGPPGSAIYSNSGYVVLGAIV